MTVGPALDHGVLVDQELVELATVSAGAAGRVECHLVASNLCIPLNSFKMSMLRDKNLIRR